eukprot:c11924_g2_i2.p1 GENE.c11924_g2_i2~~c11924_g2_i2.p1  ORF type:complete len:205 (+),score=59.99 c11924_g2_i2:389-1003(+)
MQSQEISGFQFRSQTRHHPETQKPVYAGFLSREGRLMFDSIVIPSQAVHSTPLATHATNTLLLDVHCDAAEQVVKHINLYKLRKSVQVSDVTSAYGVWALWGSDVGEVLGPSAMKCFGVDGMKMFLDPRLAALGIRILAPLDFPARNLTYHISHITNHTKHTAPNITTPHTPPPTNSNIYNNHTDTITDTITQPQHTSTTSISN